MRVRVMDTADLGRVMGEEWVDPSRRPYVDGDRAMVPVRDGYAADTTIPKRASPDIRGYQMLGDVAVVRGRPPTPEEIAAIVRRREPRGIVHIPAVGGVCREPQARLVWGSAGEVCHREEGYVYHLDPMAVMFSQANREEKCRLAHLVRRSPREERIADMFAGIGYFTIPLAGAGARVHAMEINPVAYRYLVRNLAENGLGSRVRTVPGDCRDHLDGIYDRVVMGHFHAVDMLPAVFSHVEAGSVVHVHSIGDESSRIRESAMDAGLGAAVTVRRVKKYAPGRWHMVQDMVIS